LSNSWFRLYGEFSNDPKVQMMSEVDQRRLVMLFCMRCNGHVTLQDKYVTFHMRVTSEQWKETKQRFIELGFIDSDNNILNWDKRQFISDSSTARVQKYRDKMKRYETVTVTPPEQNRTEHKKHLVNQEEKPKDPKAAEKITLIAENLATRQRINQ